MRIGITGVTGIIGQAIAALAHSRGHGVTGFSRKASLSLESVPHCQNLRLFSLNQPVNLSGLDALIHLAGEPIMGLWTDEKRRSIVASRRDTTRHLVSSLGELRKDGPGVFLCASGTGYYGDRGAEKLTENSGNGRGFLAEVCQVWEEEARAAEEYGLRTCQLRTGVVLAPNGGAYPLLRRVFFLGLGGKLGSGQQYFPWIHLADIAELYLSAAENHAYSGPINAVAPEEINNLDFTRILASSVHRPAFFSVPTFALKTVLGQLSGTVLDSQRVLPAKAVAADFPYRFPTLAAALADLG